MWIRFQQQLSLDPDDEISVNVEDNDILEKEDIEVLDSSSVSDDTGMLKIQNVNYFKSIFVS